MPSDDLNRLFLVLTGQEMPRVDVDLMRAHLVDPQRELTAHLAGVQELLVRVAQSVSGESNGEFSDAYYQAMLTLASPEGTAALEGLRDAAQQLGDYADESAYQVEYMNLMIRLQLFMFLVEFAVTFILAIWNPVGAMIRQAYLRAAYRTILNSIVFKVVSAIAMQQVLQIGLAVALDRLAQWMLARQGIHTTKGNTYLTQAVGFGAVSGLLAVPIQFGASWLAQRVTKWMKGGAGDSLFSSVSNALTNRPNRTVVRNTADDAGDQGSPTPTPLPRNRPDRMADGFAGDGLPNTVGGGGGPVADRAFARDFADRISDLSHRVARNEDPTRIGPLFLDDMGDIFARRFADDLGGEGPARSLGREWAGTFLAGMFRDDLGRALRTVVERGLPPSFGDDVVRSLSGAVADRFGPGGWGRKFTAFTIHGLGDGVLGVTSEMVYNGITLKQFVVSGGGFLWSMSSERAADGFNAVATLFADKFKPLDVTMNSVSEKTPLLVTVSTDDGTVADPGRTPAPASTSTPTPTSAPASGPAPASVNSGSGNVGALNMSTLTTGNASVPWNPLSMDDLLISTDTLDVPALPVMTPDVRDIPLIDGGTPDPAPAPVFDLNGSDPNAWLTAGDRDLPGNGVTGTDRPTGDESSDSGLHTAAPRPASDAPGPTSVTTPGESGQDSALPEHRTQTPPPPPLPPVAVPPVAGADSTTTPRTADPRAGDPRAADPRAVDSRTGDSRTADPRAGEQRTGVPRTSDVVRAADSNNSPADRPRTEGARPGPARDRPQTESGSPRTDQDRSPVGSGRPETGTRLPATNSADRLFNTLAQDPATTLPDPASSATQPSPPTRLPDAAPPTALARSSATASTESTSATTPGPQGSRPVTEHARVPDTVQSRISRALFDGDPASRVFASGRDTAVTADPGRKSGQLVSPDPAQGRSRTASAQVGPNSARAFLDSTTGDARTPGRPETVSDESDRYDTDRRDTDRLGAYRDETGPSDTDRSDTDSLPDSGYGSDTESLPDSGYGSGSEGRPAGPLTTRTDDDRPPTPLTHSEDTASAISTSVPERPGTHPSPAPPAASPVLRYPVPGREQLLLWHGQFDRAHAVLDALSPEARDKELLRAQGVMAHHHMLPGTAPRDSASGARQYERLFRDMRALVAEARITKANRPGKAAAWRVSRELSRAFGTGSTQGQLLGGTKKSSKKKQQQRAAGQPTPSTSTSSAPNPSTGSRGTPRPETVAQGPGSRSDAQPPQPPQPAQTQQPAQPPQPMPAESTPQPAPEAPEIRDELADAVTGILRGKVPPQYIGAIIDLTRTTMENPDYPDTLDLRGLLGFVSRMVIEPEEMGQMGRDLLAHPVMLPLMQSPVVGDLTDVAPGLVSVLARSPGVLSALTSEDAEGWPEETRAGVVEALARPGAVEELENDPILRESALADPRALVNLGGDLGLLRTAGRAGQQVTDLLTIPDFAGALRNTPDPTRTLWRLADDAALASALWTAPHLRGGHDGQFYYQVLADDAFQDLLRGHPDKLNLVFSSPDVLAAVRSNPQALEILGRAPELTDVLEDIPSLTARLLADRDRIEAAVANPEVARVLSYQPEHYQSVPDDELAARLQATRLPEEFRPVMNPAARLPGDLAELVETPRGREEVMGYLAELSIPMATLFNDRVTSRANARTALRLAELPDILFVLASLPEGISAPHVLRRIARLGEQMRDTPLSLPRDPAEATAVLAAAARHTPLAELLTDDDADFVRDSVSARVDRSGEFQVALQIHPGIAHLARTDPRVLAEVPLRELLGNPWLSGTLPRLRHFSPLLYGVEGLREAAYASDSALLRLLSRHPSLQYEVGDRPEWRRVADRINAAPRALGTLIAAFDELPALHWRQLLNDAPLLSALHQRHTSPTAQVLTALPEAFREVLMRPGFAAHWQSRAAELDTLAAAVLAQWDTDPSAEDDRTRAAETELMDAITRFTDATFTYQGFDLDPDHRPALERLVTALAHDAPPPRDVSDALDTRVLNAYDAVRTDPALRRAAVGSRYLAEGLLFDPALLTLARTRPSMLPLLVQPHIVSQVRQSPRLTRLLTEQDSVLDLFVSSRAHRLDLRGSNFQSQLERNPDFATVYRLHANMRQLLTPALEPLRDFLAQSPSASQALAGGVLRLGHFTGSRSLVRALAGAPENVVRAVTAAPGRIRASAEDPRLVARLARTPALADVLGDRPGIVTTATDWANLLNTRDLTDRLTATDAALTAWVLHEDRLPAMLTAPDMVKVLELSAPESWAALSAPPVLRLIDAEPGLASDLVQNPGLRLALARHTGLADLMRGNPFLLGELRARPALVTAVRAAPVLAETASPGSPVWALAERHPELAAGMTPRLRRVLEADPHLTARITARDHFTTAEAKTLRHAIRRTPVAALLSERPEFTAAFVTRTAWQERAGQDTRFPAAVRALAEQDAHAFRALLTTRDPRALLTALDQRPATAPEPAPQLPPLLRELPVEVTDLLTGPRGPQVAQAMTRNPELLPLLIANPVRTDGLDAHPERLKDYLFRDFLAERLPAPTLAGRGEDLTSPDVLNRYFAAFLTAADLTAPGDHYRTVRDAATHTWREVVEERRLALAHEWREQVRRFTDFRANNPSTWALSGTIHYAGRARGVPFSPAQEHVVTTLSQGVQSLRDRKTQRTVNNPLHAHLDGGRGGVAYVYALTGNGTVDLVVYAKSDHRVNNAYDWGTGQLSPKPPLLDQADHHPVLVESRNLVRRDDNATRPEPPVINARYPRQTEAERRVVGRSRQIAEEVARHHGAARNPVVMRVDTRQAMTDGIKRILAKELLALPYDPAKVTLLAHALAAQLGTVTPLPDRSLVTAGRAREESTGGRTPTPTANTPASTRAVPGPRQPASGRTAGPVTTGADLFRALTPGTDESGPRRVTDVHLPDDPGGSRDIANPGHLAAVSATTTPPPNPARPPSPLLDERGLRDAAHRAASTAADAFDAVRRESGRSSDDDRSTAARDLWVINCVILLQHLVDQLHAGSRPVRPVSGTGVRPARTLDDIGVGTDRTARALELGVLDDPDLALGTDPTRQRLAKGPGWARLTSWDTLTDALDRAPGSTALLLTQGTDGPLPGHAHAVHHTSQGLRWIEMQGPDGPLVTDEPLPSQPHLLAPDLLAEGNRPVGARDAHPFQTHAVVIGPDGRVIPDALTDTTRPAHTLTDALTDPPRGTTYGAASQNTGQWSLPGGSQPGPGTAESFRIPFAQGSTAVSGPAAEARIDEAARAIVSRAFGEHGSPVHIGIEGNEGRSQSVLRALHEVLSAYLPDRGPWQRRIALDDFHITLDAAPAGERDVRILVEDAPMQPVDHLFAAMLPDIPEEAGPLGPDLFGLRIDAPTPEFLQDFDYDRLDPSGVGAFFTEISLTRGAPTRILTPEEFGGGAVVPSAAGGVPLVRYAIWLGGPLTDAGKKGEFREFVLDAARKFGPRVTTVLFTDVTRDDVARAWDTPEGNPAVRGMVEWAQAQNIQLVNTGEVFNESSPLNLRDEYVTEHTRQVGRGYAAASDILRVEIVHRFGGIYMDGDNRVPDNPVAEIAAGFASATMLKAPGAVNNLLIAPRQHPKYAEVLDLIGENYTRDQKDLFLYDDLRRGFTEREWESRMDDDMDTAVRRSSVMWRSGPYAARYLFLGDDVFASAPASYSFSWRRTLAGDSVIELDSPEGRESLVKIAATMVRELFNRSWGDLHFTLITPALEKLSDPDAAGAAVLEFISRVPELAAKVTTITTHLLSTRNEFDPQHKWDRLDAARIPSLAHRFIYLHGNPRWILGEIVVPATMGGPWNGAERITDSVAYGEVESLAEDWRQGIPLQRPDAGDTQAMDTDAGNGEAEDEESGGSEGETSDTDLIMDMMDEDSDREGSGSEGETSDTDLIMDMMDDEGSDPSSDGTDDGVLRLRGGADPSWSQPRPLLPQGGTPLPAPHQERLGGSSSRATGDSGRTAGQSRNQTTFEIVFTEGTTNFPRTASATINQAAQHIAAHTFRTPGRPAPRIYVMGYDARSAAPSAPPADGRHAKTVGTALRQAIASLIPPHGQWQRQFTVYDFPISVGNAPAASGVKIVIENRSRRLVDRLFAAVRPNLPQETGHLGPDIFGLRGHPEAPAFLQRFDSRQLAPEGVAAFFRTISMTRQTPTHALNPVEFTGGTVITSSGGSIPLVRYAIWLGGPLRDQGKMQEFRDGLTSAAARFGPSVTTVLFTDVTRSQIEASADPSQGDSATRSMVNWARSHSIQLVHPDEIFTAASPMTLRAEYATEHIRQVGRGYAAASDILRLEILERFGGIYMDGDDGLSTENDPLKTMADQLATSSMLKAAHNANSLYIAPRRHPAIRQYLDTVRFNYTQDQRSLFLSRFNKDEFESPMDQTDHTIMRRSSVMWRTGPYVAERINLGADFQAMEINSSGSWNPGIKNDIKISLDSTEGRAFLVKIAATLVREMFNRPGDLHFTLITPALERLSHPDEAGSALLEFIARTPDLAARVQFITTHMIYSKPYHNGTGGDDGLFEALIPSRAHEFISMDHPNLRPMWSLGEIVAPIRMVGPNERGIVKDSPVYAEIVDAVSEWRDEPGTGESQQRN